MTAKTNLDWMQEAADRIMNDPVKLKEFMRKVMGPERRTVLSPEREHLLTIFALLEPISESNNQRTFTQVYEHAGKVYHVTSGWDEEEIEEILPDEES